MTNWSSGYVSDIEYTSNFYRELAPSYLRYVCLTQGIRPPPLGAGATYCELGCGQGIGTAIIAAANPGIHFWGIDFNPAQIVNARRIADEAGLTNITFLDHSFEEALGQPAGTYPQFDYITLHGIYSWVSEENRRFVVRFLNRYLKPGGMVFVSYNSQPGWSGITPLQRLFREYAVRHPKRSDVQASESLAFAIKLASAKGGYFVQNPSVVESFKELAVADPQYLAHEYLNAHWQPMFHADVAEDLEAAKLTFVGSASLFENNDRISLPESVLPLLEESSDPVWRETVRDFARNQKFRQDIFMRGASPMKPVEHADSLAKVQIALLKDRAAVPPTFQAQGAKLKVPAEIVGALLDALCQRAHSIGELAALPALRGTPGPRVVEAINVLIHTGQAHPLIEQTPGPGATRQTLNAAIAAKLHHGVILKDITVPAAGTGMKASYVDLLAILALSEGMNPDPQAVAEFGWSVMHRTGQRMMKGKSSLQGREENIAELHGHFQRIFASELPVWKALNVV